jgi:DNA modification methylase
MEVDVIYNEDCYKGIKNIPDKSIDLIYTDPPYDIGDGGCTGLFKNRNHKNGGLYMTQIMEGNFGKGFDFSLLEEYVRVMKRIYIYIWCNKEQLYDYLDFFVKKHNCNFEIIVWKKPTFPPFTCGHFCKDKEICLCFWEKGKVKITGSWDEMRTVVEYPVNIKDKELYVHPTIKPLDEVKKRILNSTQEGDVVLDTFMGSGTTAVACKQLNRHYIGFELNPEYYQIAIDRVNGITQKDKKLKELGQLSLFDIE